MEKEDTGKKNSVTAEERRIFPRLSIETFFRYCVVKKDTGSNLYYEEAKTKNISASGMLFESKDQIPIDAELKILLKLPGAVKEFEITGKVARIEKLDTGLFDIGVVFSMILEEQKKEIKQRLERMDIIKLLEQANNEEISDIHLTASSPVMIRSYGVLKPLNKEPLDREEVKQMIYSILSESQKQTFEAQKDLDFTFSPTLNIRFRVSIYQQRGATEIVLRNILPGIKSREELGLPDVIEDLCQLKEGIIIIGGTTGSGKSTTISTMIDIINRKKGGVILSLEKPIEYLHKNIKAIVKQREVGVDVPSFASGLRASLRQDADVIVVGEILDSDSMEAALEAAETGHLVITSLHATDVVQVFDRIISLFPIESRNYIYTRLSHSLKAVIIQRLLLSSAGTGRVVATEVCTVNTAVKRIISSGDFIQLPSIIETGSQFKMETMQESIDRLFQQGLISAETYDTYSKRIVTK